MKTKLPQTLLLSAALLTVLATGAFAQRQLGKNKGPTSKIYLAETKGDTQIANNDKIYTARQGTAFDAPGTVIETKVDSHSAFVYSNGTGMYVDQNTRVEIKRFAQELFQPDRSSSADALVEPSISQTEVFVARGTVGICTSRLVSGSTMSYSTPQATMTIRNGRVSIQSTPEATTIDLLEGDVTVRGNDDNNVGGQVLRPGERAIIRPGAAGQPPALAIMQIPSAVVPALDERVSVACNARRTVTFNTIERRAVQGLDAQTGVATSGAAPGRGTTGSAADGDSAAGADQVIVAQPTVPEKLPTNITVSADRLPGGTH